MQHKISWLNIPGYAPATWNPIVGCTKISEGCKNCYAERMANRLAGMPVETKGGKKIDSRLAYSSVIENGHWNEKTAIVDSAINIPMKWKDPHAVFVVSMGDLFHESVPDEWVRKVLEIIYHKPTHIFIVLTKRADRMAQYFAKFKNSNLSQNFPNLWLGVTAENQDQANKRIPVLLQIPAAKRFVSIEPMLGPVKLYRWNGFDDKNNWTNNLDWIICGGESGPGARPMHPDWVRSLQIKCQEAEVPFFFKQWGEWYTSYCNMVSGVHTFKMFTSYLHFSQKDWVKKGDVVIDLLGKICKTGGDMKNAQYPVAIMQKVGRSKAGDLLDGKQYHEWPELS